MGTLVQQRQLAAVTGASSGIGLELARRFAQHGYDLVICGEDSQILRAAEELEATGVRVWAVQVDLRTHDGVETFYREIKRQVSPLDVIALSAGVVAGGDFTSESRFDDEETLIRLNVTSVVHLAKLVAWDMVERGSGRILITPSPGANMPATLGAMHPAPTAFDLSFAASLRKELEDTGVTVTALLPGATDTEVFQRAGLARVAAPTPSLLRTGRLF